MPTSTKRGRGLRPRQSRSRAKYVVIAAFLIVALGASVVIVNVLGTLGPVFTTPPPATLLNVTPVPTPEAPTEPVNILLIGVDRREGETSTLNDVNIVVRIDPRYNSASMLSIPRDLRVYIPGAEVEAKINASYMLGENMTPGGGPTLVKSTVSQFLGLPIHYYAEVDFRGFERIVDLVDGVTVDVAAPLIDNEYPTDDYGYTRIYIPGGLQHMDGVTALQYARSRHADSDVGRNQRQQQVLMALRNRILNRRTLLDVNRMDQLLKEMSGSLRTDIPLLTLYALAQLAPKIDMGHISQYALDWNACYEIQGTYDLACDPTAVRNIVDQMQANPQISMLQQEAATVGVYNGTDECTGCASRAAGFLRDNGFQIITYTNMPDQVVYTHTLVLDSGNHAFSRDLIAELLHLQPEAVRTGPIDFSTADIVVVIGQDFEPPE